MSEPSVVPNVRGLRIAVAVSAIHGRTRIASKRSRCFVRQIVELGICTFGVTGRGAWRVAPVAMFKPDEHPVRSYLTPSS